LEFRGERTMAHTIKIAIVILVVGLIFFVVADVAFLLLEDSKLIVFGIGALGVIFSLIGIILIFMALDIKLKISGKKVEEKQGQPQDVSPSVQATQPAPQQQYAPPQPAVTRPTTVVQQPPQPQYTPPPQPKVESRPTQAEIAAPKTQEEVKKVRCPACSTVFTYVKNPKGPTWVKCPNCGKEGVVY